MSTEKIRVVIDGVMARVYLGDREVKNVRAYRLTHEEPGAVAVLQLDLLALDVEIVGDGVLVETTTMNPPEATRSFALR